MPSRTRLFLLCAILLTAVFFTSCRQTGYYLEKGNRFFSQGKYQDAEINFRKALQRDPNSGEAYFQLGLTLARLGNAPEAYTSLSRAADLLPNRTDVKAKAGEFLLEMYIADSRRPRLLHDRIATLAEQLLSGNTNSSSYDGLRLKAYLASLDGDPTAAEQYFRKADSAKPFQPDLTLAWAQTLMLEKRPGEAEQLARRLIDHDKSYGPMYEFLSRYYFGAGHFDDAEKILREQAANIPANVRSALDLAAFYAQRSREADIKAVLQQVTDNLRTFPDGRLQAGDFYGSLHRPDDAILQYEAGAAADPKQKSVYLKRIANAWLVQGQNERATRVTDEILKENPKDDAGKAVNASLLLASNKPADIAKAESIYKSLVDANPDDAAMRYNLGVALAVKGDLDSARGELKDAIHKQPDLIAARIALVELNESNGDYKTALQDADEALRLAPNSVRLRLLRAVSLIYTGNSIAAANDLGNLEKAFPANRELQLDLAALDRHENRLAQAEERLRKLLQGDAADTRAMAALAETLIAEKHPDLAVSMLEDNIRKSPESAPVHSILAKVAAKTGNYDLAIEQYRWLAAAAPDSPAANIELGNALQFKGDMAGAITCFEKAVALSPNDGRARELLGNALASSGRPTEALASYRRAFQLGRTGSPVLNATAYLIAQTGGDLNEAARLAQQALSNEPGQPDYSDTLGWVYLKKNQAAAAIQMFRDNADKHPEQAIFHYHFAMALLQQGDRQAAEVELKNALSGNPTAQTRHDIETAMAGRKSGS